MNTTPTEKDNLYKGLGLFIEAMRLYIAALLQERYSKDWPQAFALTLYDEQRTFWDSQIKEGREPESMIDFSNLKGFAIKYKDLLKRDFEKQTRRLGTWFDEINEVRNAIAHHDKEIDRNSIIKTWIHLETIARALKMTKLLDEILQLREIEVKENQPARAPKVIKLLGSRQQAAGSRQPESSGQLPVVSGQSSESRPQVIDGGQQSSSPAPAVPQSAPIAPPSHAPEPRTFFAASTLPRAARPWFQTVVPHLDIRTSSLDESVYAANLSEVALGTGREIYLNPVIFFSKTFFTSGLKAIARTVINGLNGRADSENRVMSLQTGFGGGKTHTLIALYHLCKWGRDAATSDTLRELIQTTGTPDFDSAKIAVFTNTTNDPANGRTTPDGVHIQTIWGELAYQLGGREAFEIVRKNDEQLIAPAGLFKQVLARCRPALILLDELADYCVKASARIAGNSTLADQTISFMQELTQAVAESNQCVLLATLPMSVNEITGNPVLAQQILTALEQRVRRIGADTKPVSDEEIYEVIRRRLFEDIGPEEHIEAAVGAYMQLFEENHSALPPHVTRAEYRAKLFKSYPFHPELIDVFRVRWASHHEFQRTRGVLRLLAAIVTDLWRRQDTLTGPNLLLDAGEVNFATLDALSGQLKRLYGNGFDAVIVGDVAGPQANAAKIDRAKKQYGANRLAQAIASVVLLNSFGSDGANKGVSVADIKLHLLEPNGFNHNNINGALDELESTAYYLYYTQIGGAGKRYWFHVKPNINILINQAKSDVTQEATSTEILRRINEKSRTVQNFNVLVNPSGDVPEQTKLTLVILGPQYVANAHRLDGRTLAHIERIATKKGNSERIYRNTMLFLGASEIGLVHLSNAVRDFLACKKISDDYNSQIDRDQREELRKKIEEASKQADVALVNAYSVVLKYAVKQGCQMLSIKEFRDTLDAQINNNVTKALKEEEWLLESIGLGTLRHNNLLPTSAQPVRAKDVYEAFLRFDDKPMILNAEAVKKSLTKYCYEGSFALAAGDGKTFSSVYLRENVPFLDVNDANYWLADAALKKASEPPPPPVPTGNGTGSGRDVTQPELPRKPTHETSETLTIEPVVAPTKSFTAMTISGGVSIENFTQLVSYFIGPFTGNGHKVEIQVSFRVTASHENPFTESQQQVKNAQESAKQLGLNFRQE